MCPSSRKVLEDWVSKKGETGLAHLTMPDFVPPWPVVTLPDLAICQGRT